MAIGFGSPTWRRQKRTLERLPSHLVVALLRHRRLLYPSLLEVFQQCIEEVDLSGEGIVDAEWIVTLSISATLTASTKPFEVPWGCEIESLESASDLRRWLLDSGLRHGGGRSGPSSASPPTSSSPSFATAAYSALLSSRAWIVTLFGQLQMDAMREVSATGAAIVNGLEPVWGAASAWFLLGKRWGTTEWLGAALVL